MANIPLTASSRRDNQRNNNRGKRNGWAAKWSDELRLKDGDTAWISLTPGDYPAEDGDRSQFLGLPMFKVQYTNKWGNQSWGYFRGEESGTCTLSERADCGDTRVSSPRYGEPNRFFMNVVHFDLFRREQVNDKSGAPLRYRHGKLKGEIVHRWDAINSLREKKDTIKQKKFDDCCFFRKKFLELPATHFEKIKEIGRQAGQMCGCGGSLFPAVYTCETCEDILLDVEDTDLTEGEVKRFGDNSIRCGACGHVGYPQSQSLCDSCEDPTPLHFWEVAAQITKVREGQWPTIRVDKVIPLADFRLADGTSPVAVDEDGNPELDAEGKLIFPEDLDKLVKAQFDLGLYTEAKGNAHFSELLELREDDIGYESGSKDYGRFRK